MQAAHEARARRDPGPTTRQAAETQYSRTVPTGSARIPHTNT